MPIFKKKSPELIDLTELQKKGTLQRSQRLEKINSSPIKNNDFVDISVISRKPSQITTVQTPVQNSTDSAASPLTDFLSSLASANSQSESSIPQAPITQEPKTQISQSLNSTDLSSLKIKLEDIEFKLDNFITRLQKLEEKLEKSQGS